MVATTAQRALHPVQAGWGPRMAWIANEALSTLPICLLMAFLPNLTAYVSEQNSRTLAVPFFLLMLAMIGTMIASKALHWYQRMNTPGALHPDSGPSAIIPRVLASTLENALLAYLAFRLIQHPGTNVTVTFWVLASLGLAFFAALAMRLVRAFHEVYHGQPYALRTLQVALVNLLPPAVVLLVAASVMTGFAALPQLLGLVLLVCLIASAFGMVFTLAPLAPGAFREGAEDISRRIVDSTDAAPTLRAYSDSKRAVHVVLVVAIGLLAVWFSASLIFG